MLAQPAQRRMEHRGASARQQVVIRPMGRSFPRRARARGISDATYTPGDGQHQARHLGLRARSARSPNSTSSSGNISTAASPTGASSTGKEKAKEHAPLLARIEKDYGVDRSVMLGLWGIESAFGDPVVQKNHMRPVIPALAALAWGEPRRRAYWEQELLNALVIVERGWSTPEEMRGSWAGAMGHTQWMPEVWLNIGRRLRRRRPRRRRSASPTTRSPAPRTISSSAASIARGEHWGYEVRGVPARPAKARRAATKPGRRPASRAPTASRSRSRTRPRSCGCRCRAGRPSCSGRISMRCAPTIRR